MPTFTSPRPLIAVVGFIVCVIIVLLMALGVATSIPPWAIWVGLAGAFACLIW